MTILVATAPFKACAPAEEFFDYPLFFPKLKFRGRPNPSDDGTEEHGRPQEKNRREEEVEIFVPEPSIQKQKFNQVSGGKRTLSIQKIGDLAREMGFAPSQADVAVLHEQFGDEATYEQFQEWLMTYCIPHKKADNARELESCFKDLDSQGDGMLTRTQMYRLLGTYGEGLTEGEIDAIFKAMGITGDRINYHHFVLKLLAEEPVL